MPNNLSAFLFIAEADARLLLNVFKPRAETSANYPNQQQGTEVR